MTGLEVAAVVGFVALTLVAALLAAAETSLTRMSAARAEALHEDGRRGSAMLVRLVAERERILNPLLFLVLACHLGAATLVGALVQERWGLGAFFVAFVVELVVIFVVAEAIPKTLALSDLDRTALRLAPLMRAIGVFAPLRWVTSGLLAIAAKLTPGDRRGSIVVLEDELLALAHQAAADETIEAEEQVLIESIIGFGDTLVREVMVPRPDMVVVHEDETIEQVLAKVDETGLSRSPVYRSGIDDIVGVTLLKDLVKAMRGGRGGQPVSTAMRESNFVPETKRTAELLREMQAASFHLAVVVDEYGGTAGLVTLEDLIEELVGEIVDEFDVEEPMIEKAEDGLIRVNGRVPLDLLSEVLGTDLPDGEWSTVGGLIVNSLGHIPDVGETLDVGEHQLRVERVDGRRIARVQVRPLVDA
jgi:putative hemolysin